MRILYNNLIDAAPYITPSTEATGYDVENVQDERLSTVWKTDTTTTQTAIIDLGAAYSVNSFGVLGHNLSATGCTVIGNSVIGGSVSSMIWDASGQSSVQTITYTSGAMLKFVSPMSYRYWKFTFTGLTAALQVGRLWIGNYLTISPSSLLNFEVDLKQNDTVVFSKSGQKFATPGITWREFSLSFPPTDSTMISSIKTMFETVGNHNSVVFLNFDDLTSYDLVLPCYCSLDGDIGFTHTESQKYSYSLKLSENK